MSHKTKVLILSLTVISVIVFGILFVVGGTMTGHLPKTQPVVQSTAPAVATLPQVSVSQATPLEPVTTPNTTQYTTSASTSSADQPGKSEDSSAQSGLTGHVKKLLRDIL